MFRERFYRGTKGPAPLSCLLVLFAIPFLIWFVLYVGSEITEEFEETPPPVIEHPIELED